MPDPLDSLRLPTAAATRLALRVTPPAAKTLRARHPWVFADGIRDQSDDGNPGDLAVAFDQDRKFLAIGLYDPDSPIRLRVLQHATPAVIDDAFFGVRIAAAIALRTAVAAASTGYRVIHGENDGFPGLVVDRYGATLVIKLYTTAWVSHLRCVIGHLRAQLLPERIVLRLNDTTQEKPERLHGLADAMTLIGDPPTGPVEFTENGLHFGADVLRGQKTGFFFDQRDNRVRVEALARGATVLNVCAYTGGFSLYAARGGATRVVSLDLSRPALQAAEHNFEINRSDAGVAACRHETVAGDAFEVMGAMAKRHESFDLVILDPPSFARRAADVPQALRAYGRLARAGLAVLRPGGTLVAASCSSRVSTEDFFATIEKAADDARRPLTVTARTFHPPDHPVTFAEGAYLKCLFAVAP